MQTTKVISDWITDLPRPAVVCTIAAITGSAPQQAGAKMWVTEDSFIGTIGGGEFERRVLVYARQLLGSPKVELKEFVLCKEMGQCCGGRVQMLFEPVSKRKAIHLFGAGHVGRATAEVLAGMPFDIQLIDPRPEWAQPAGVASEIHVRQADPLEYARSTSWSANDAVCIFTHSHELDLQLTHFFLDQPVGYLGLIGSHHKADVFKARLASLKSTHFPALKTLSVDEIDALWDEKVRCPIGISLDSKNPKIIAVSVAAELLRDWGLKNSQALELAEVG